MMEGSFSEERPTASPQAASPGKGSPSGVPSRGIAGGCWEEILMGGLAALLLLPVLRWPFQHDQSIFATIAEAMGRGQVLYRDVWEHKPPGVFVTYYWAFLFLGRDLWAVHVLEILALAIASSGLYRLGSRRLHSRLSGAAAALAMPLVYLPWSTTCAQPEVFAIPFIVWGYAIWPLPGDSRFRVQRCFMSGLLMSVAVLYKTPMVFTPVLLGVGRLVEDRTGRSWREKLGPALATAGGVAVLPLAVVLYYAARGGWAEFWDANIRFPSLYAAPSIGGKSLWDHREALHWLRWLVPWPGLLLVALGYARGLWIRPAETVRWAAAFGSGWAAVIVQAKYWPYHHLVLLPYLAASYGLAFMPERAKESSGPAHRRIVEPAARAAAWALACLALVAYGGTFVAEWSQGIRPATRKVAPGRPDRRASWASNEDVARVIRECTNPADKIFVWGDRAILYVLSDRPLAGPYPHLMPVLAWFLGPEGKDRLDRLIGRLAEERPRLFVVAPGALWWYGNHEPREIIDQFPALKRYLTDCYRLTERVGEFEIWTIQP